MSEESFEELLQNEDSIKSVRVGETVKGTVIDVKDNEIVLNINYKSDGIIAKNEYTADADADLKSLVSPGDEIRAKVLKVNDGDGQVQLSYRRLRADAGNQKLEQAFENKEVLTAKVTQVVSGGLNVTVDETRVFIPASLVSDSFVRDLSVYKDQDVEFIISEYNPQQRRIIGDCRTLILEKKKVLKEELLQKIAVNDKIHGTVKNVTDFGAFIDLGGVDGLLHISEMSWGRTDSPKKLYKVGDEVDCFIKEINGEKIALSVKFPENNPWNAASSKYAKDNIVKGTVARMTDFGAFIQLEDGIDALLHVSQISREHVDKPSDVLSIGQEIEAKVVDFNPDEKKISLSIKQAGLEPKKADEGEASDTVYSTDDVKEEEPAPAAEEAPAEAPAEEAPAAEAEAPAAEEAPADEAPAAEAETEAPAEEAPAQEEHKNPLQNPENSGIAD